MFNTLLPLLLAIPITVTPYRSPQQFTIEQLCEDIADSLSIAVNDKVIEPHEALAIYVRCLQIK